MVSWQSIKKSYVSLIEKKETFSEQINKSREKDMDGISVHS